MRKRDKEIIEAVNKFRVLDRNHIIRMFFQDLSQPVVVANRILKRLVYEGHLKMNRSTKPFSYYPCGSKMKHNSTKIPHFFSIADFYIELCNYAKPTRFEVEWKTGEKGSVEPDIFMVWNGAPFFVEIQRNRYTDKVMNKKGSRYIDYFRKDTWREHTEYFPFVWIVSESKYKNLNWEDLKVYQSKTVEHFVDKYMRK